MHKPELLKIACILCVFCATTVTSRAQVLTTLYSFEGPPDGAYSSAGLALGANGNFYGTTAYGGANNLGTIFEITPSGTVTILHSFAGTPNDGNLPVNGLLLASDGNFYGTTAYGGANNEGTIFKVSPSGVLTTLYSFCSQLNCPDGALPTDVLIQATDGNFYGTTERGGAYGGRYSGGTVFKMTPSGNLTTLYSFCALANCADGEYPYAGLLQASDGNFYGVTISGGVYTYDGTVFRITPSGALTTLHSFDGSDGLSPIASLIQATDGDLYGAAEGGGDQNAGTIFKITLSGNLTTLHTFSGNDGRYPAAALLQASDGNFYSTTAYGGMTISGGASNFGTVFKITPAGVVTTLHSFEATDGAGPYAPLFLAADHIFYSTTNDGGTHGFGTVFSLTFPRICTVCSSTLEPR